MDDGKKKAVMIGVAVVCVVLAIMLTMKNRGKKSTGAEMFEGVPMWMKCVSQDCQAEFQIDKGGYYKGIKQYMTPGGSVGAMPCKECGELAAFQAVKCLKCDLVFVRGAAGVPFKDTCPDCGYSDMEEKRKTAAPRREK